MSVSQVRPLYASMSQRIAHARQSFGRPLTLTEKILASHCWDFDSQVVGARQGHPQDCAWTGWRCRTSPARWRSSSS